MNINAMLVRLECSMERDDLIEQMVLLPESVASAINRAESTHSINLVVGYNASPSSQTALDLTLWIAHQTRLTTQKPVTVQVVYVVEDHQTKQDSSNVSSIDNHQRTISPFPSELTKGKVSNKSSTSTLTQPKSPALAIARKKKSLKQNRGQTTLAEAFEQADRILWQARCLAEEWRGSFKAHLRFGDVASELKAVVEAEAATFLFLGCHSVQHPIVQKIGSNFPCSILGIPTEISLE